jgi:hypothetical protein
MARKWWTLTAVCVGVLTLSASLFSLLNVLVLYLQNQLGYSRGSR